jgi:hypothetical protein
MTRGAILGRGLLGLLLAALAGAVPYAGWTSAAAPGRFPERLLVWATGVLPFVVLIGLPTGLAAAMLLRKIGRESLPVYLAAGLLLSAAVVGLIALIEPLWIVMMPGALAAGATMAVCYWRLIRRRQRAEPSPGRPA